jgi:hypothetical protein
MCGLSQEPNHGIGFLNANSRCSECCLDEILKGVLFLGIVFSAAENSLLYTFRLGKEGNIFCLVMCSFQTGRTQKVYFSYIGSG